MAILEWKSGFNLTWELTMDKQSVTQRLFCDGHESEYFISPHLTAARLSLFQLGEAEKKTKINICMEY